MPRPSYRMQIMSGVIFTAAISLCVGATDPLVGKQGEALKNAVAAAYRPTTIASSLDFLESIGPDGTVYSPFDGGTYADMQKLMALPMAPAEWWRTERKYHPAMVDTLAADLHNFIAAPSGSDNYKRDYPPGYVSDATMDNGVWQTGYMMIGTVETNGWTPPKEIRGDVARILLYMATVYSTPYWEPRAGIVFTDASYPGLTQYGISLLLDWHRTDPVSEAERQRDDVARHMQGNSNPFVSRPDLVEYLWGDKANDRYRDPQTPEEEENLRGTYSLSSDRVVCLCSPYVEEPAVWRVDGRKVTGRTVATTDLGLGDHEITFSAQGVDGRVWIRINP